MKKMLLLWVLIISIMFVSWCGVKNIDDVIVVNTGDNNAIVIQDTGNFVDASGNFVWVEEEKFASGSDTISDNSGNIIPGSKASRISDEWCKWKKYSKFGVSFIAEECNLDGRILNLISIDDKKIFAVQQDDYEIDLENMEDTLWIQVFDIASSVSLADGIRDVVWVNCDITPIQDKKVWNYDIYTVHTMDAQDSTCNWYGNVDAPENSLNKIFVDSTKPKRFVFMNLKNQQNIVDLNNFKIN